MMELIFWKFNKANQLSFEHVEDKAISAEASNIEINAIDVKLRYWKLVKMPVL